MVAHVRAHVYGNGDFLTETKLRTIKGESLADELLDIEKVIDSVIDQLLEMET